MEVLNMKVLHIKVSHMKVSHTIGVVVAMKVSRAIDVFSCAWKC
jgi:hypothetical protein